MLQPSTLARSTLFGAILLVSAVLGVRPCDAAEEAWKFLDGLRHRGYYDIAIEYLDQAGGKADIPADFKDEVDYQAGITLLDSSRLAETIDARQRQLEQARQRFEKFLKAHAQHPRAAEAEAELAKVLVERGKIGMELAASPSKSTAEKQRLTENARQLFRDAQKTFEAAEARLRTSLKELESAKPDEKRSPRELQQRDQMRGQFVQTRLCVASTMYEIAQTFEPGSEMRQKQLQEAATAFRELYEKYGNYAGGMFARMWEGRVYKDLGDPKKAAGIFEEMLTLPSTPEAFQRLRNQALTLLLEMDVASKHYAEALDRVKQWEASARSEEKSTPDGLAIQYQAAMAALESARALGENADGYRAAVADAKRYVDFLDRFPGIWQRKSRELAAASPELGGVRFEEPKTYEEARDRADSAWGTLLVLLGRLAQNDPKQREKLTADKNQARTDAIHYYRQALAIKPADADIREVNSDRFRLAYLYWDAGDYERAAVMGEFLARQYPQSAGARKGAEIAVKAYRMMFAAAPPGADRRFELDQIRRLTDYMVKLWPKEPESDEAVMMLIDTAADQCDLANVMECLGRIPDDSPRRGAAELRAGQAVWSAYVRAANLPEDQRPSAEELGKMAKQARQSLQQGVDRMRKAVEGGAQPDYALVFSVLALAQMFNADGQSDQAAQLLDDPRIGPMTLIAANSPLTNRDDFKADVYREALRAYVGSRQLDKAQHVMGLLEKTVGSDGDAQANRRLTQVYIRLGRELQEQLMRLRQENKVDQLQSVSKSFVRFLEAISKRDEGNNFSSLHWVAETYYGLGAGLDPGGKTLPPDAQQYYSKAAETFQTILDRCKKDPAFAPQPTAITSVTLRLASSLRALGKYDEAMKLLLGILAEKENRLDAQVEAALTYEGWGRERPGYYEIAIRGGHEKDGRYLVWGWGGIANRVAPFDKFRSTFHEARYHLALCRFSLAQTQTGDQRTQTLKDAELDITRIYRLYPEMGGEQWYPKYDGLLKKIQQLLGEDPVGLKGMRGPSVANTN